MFKYLVLSLLITSSIDAQNIYKLQSGNINFFAGTPIEDIDANNTKAIGFLNIKTGEIMISIPNKEFHFKRALMEEHFNENYMESEKYPKSEFKGKIADIDKFTINSKDLFKTTATGILNIHGVAKERTIEITIWSVDGTISGKTAFLIPLADHKIDRPQIVWEKLAENVQITANLIYELYQK